MDRSSMHIFIRRLRRRLKIIAAHLSALISVSEMPQIKPVCENLVHLEGNKRVAKNKLQIDHSV